MLNILLLPMLFSMLGGTYLYLRRPGLRPQAVLIVTLMQLTGALGYSTQPTPEVFTLLSLHALIVLALLLHHLQNPVLAHEHQQP